MRDDTLGFLVGIALGGLIVGTVLSLAALSIGVHGERSAAIRAHCASYRLNSETGAVEFKWGGTRCGVPDSWP